jgi:Tol biopolymer transport system component
VKPFLAIAFFAAAASAQTGVFEANGDVGITPKPGAAEFDGSSARYRVTGGGANIWAAQDAFFFAWKRISGDAAIQADVAFEGTGAVAHRKAVLMFRQGLEPDAPYADVALHGDGLTSLQYRTTAGGATQEVRSTVSAPLRLRIERRGDRFTISVGAPGGPQTESGPVTVTLKDPVYAGIGVCSHDANVLETAVFSNVRLGPPPAPQPRLHSKITVFDRSTRTARVLFRSDEIWEAPNWSRDGKYLLANSGGNLYRLAVDAENPVPQKLELPAGLRCNNDHDLSRDGRMLGFSASSPTARYSQVYVAAADGRDTKLFTPATSASYFHGWSPDGRWLAFVGQRNGKFELFRVAAGGGEEQRLTSKGGYDDGPDYSPDGRWIYFNSNRSGKWEIWRMPPEGAGNGDAKAQQVTSDELENWFPHVSPNGKWIVYLSFPKGTANHNDRMSGVRLSVIPAPGKHARPVAGSGIAVIYGGQGSINVNSWAPDSNRFAYVEYEPAQ